MAKRIPRPKAAKEEPKEETEEVERPTSLVLGHGAFAFEIPGYPKDEGPQGINIPAGAGGGLFTEHGTVYLTMDAGAFHWLWETAEAQALDFYRRWRDTTMQEASVRALSVIREAGQQQHPEILEKKAAKQKKLRLERKKMATKKKVAKPVKKAAASKPKPDLDFAPSKPLRKVRIKKG